MAIKRPHAFLGPLPLFISFFRRASLVLTRLRNTFCLARPHTNLDNRLHCPPLPPCSVVDALLVLPSPRFAQQRGQNTQHPRPPRPAYRLPHSHRTFASCRCAVACATPAQTRPSSTPAVLVVAWPRRIAQNAGRTHRDGPHEHWTLSRRVGFTRVALILPRLGKLPTKRSRVATPHQVATASAVGHSIQVQLRRLCSNARWALCGQKRFPG